MIKIKYPIILLILLSPILFKSEYLLINQEFFVILSFLLVFYYMLKFTKDMVISELEYREKVIAEIYIQLLEKNRIEKKKQSIEYQNKYLSIFSLGESLGEYAKIYMGMIEKRKELYLKKFTIFKNIELNINLIKKIVKMKAINKKKKDMHEKMDKLIASLKKMKRDKEIRLKIEEDLEKRRILNKKWNGTNGLHREI